MKKHFRLYGVPTKSQVYQITIYFILYSSAFRQFINLKRLLLLWYSFTSAFPYQWFTKNLINFVCPSVLPVRPYCLDIGSDILPMVTTCRLPDRLCYCCYFVLNLPSLNNVFRMLQKCLEASPISETFQLFVQRKQNCISIVAWKWDGDNVTYYWFYWLLNAVLSIQG